MPSIANDNTPLAYLITFTCYGARLHAGDAPSVDRDQNIYRTPYLSTNLKRNRDVANRMQEASYVLDARRREIVLTAILDTADYKGWKLYAAHVRTNHVHMVIRSDHDAEFIMNTMKSYASRHLNRAAVDEDRLKRWTRHGSTRNLWDVINVSAAINYVVNEQGAPMAVFEFV